MSPVKHVTKPGEPKPTKRSAAKADSPGERKLKIGEAAKLVGVKPYVLRFWETEFPKLRRDHAPFSHRLYDANDVKNFRLIKRLLHEDGYTIAGARKYLKSTAIEGARGAKGSPAATGATGATTRHSESALKRVLLDMRRELQLIRKILA
jgi:DNA-binding transcriptional MerR regulator